MSDKDTIGVYDARAAEYAEQNEKHNRTDPRLTDFIAACPRGGRVLDLGCGPGGAAAVMVGAGLIVDATDASQQMVALASQHQGVQARQATFDDISGSDLYDGIWANFSLLHAPRADFPRLLAALHKALKPGGAFYIAMKLGKGESRDAIGRLYAYYTQDALRAHLEAAGFRVLDQVPGSSRGLDGEMADWVSVAAHG